MRGVAIVIYSRLLPVEGQDSRPAEEQAGRRAGHSPKAARLRSRQNARLQAIAADLQSCTAVDVGVAWFRAQLLSAQCAVSIAHVRTRIPTHVGV